MLLVLVENLHLRKFMIAVLVRCPRFPCYVMSDVGHIAVFTRHLAQNMLRLRTYCTYFPCHCCLFTSNAIQTSGRNT